MNEEKPAVDLEHAYRAMKEFLSRYQNEQDPGFEVKTVHTYHTAEFAREICEKENLVEERDLAVLIALLHDVGRFEELRIRRELNSAAFDHASYGVKMLREGLIRDFIDTDVYDDIILGAIGAHSLYELPEMENERTLLHARLLRDADKLDNLRIKAYEPLTHMFGSRFQSMAEMEESTISATVMEQLRQRRCVLVRDRKTPLDYYVTVIGFWFDLSFESSRSIVREHRWIETMISRFDYKDPLVRKQMEEILALTAGHPACA